MSSTAAAYSALVNNKTPMGLLSLIITNSLIMAYFTFLKTLSMWGSLLLLMVYVSGVMVLFMYIVSLTPTGSSKPNLSLMKWHLIGACILAGLMSTPLNSVKNPNKFLFSFEKTMSLLWVSLMILIVIGAIIPVVLMANHKGLSTSK